MCPLFFVPYKTYKKTMKTVRSYIGITGFHYMFCSFVQVVVPIVNYLSAFLNVAQSLSQNYLLRLTTHVYALVSYVVVTFYTFIRRVIRHFKRDINISGLLCVINVLLVKNMTCWHQWLIRNININYLYKCDLFAAVLSRVYNNRPNTYPAISTFWTAPVKYAGIRS